MRCLEMIKLVFDYLCSRHTDTCSGHAVTYLMHVPPLSPRLSLDYVVNFGSFIEYSSLLVKAHSLGAIYFPCPSNHLMT